MPKRLTPALLLDDKAIQLQIDAHGMAGSEEVQAARHAIEAVSFAPAFPTPPESRMPQQGSAIVPAPAFPNTPCVKMPVPVPVPAPTQH